MNISKPEPEKGSIKVCTNVVKSGSSADGLVRGTDPHAYLGHFRSPDVIKKGHNQGAPGISYGPDVKKPPMTGLAPGGDFGGGGLGGGMKPGASAPGTGVPALGRVKPMFNATTNPIAATRQQNRADVAAAKLSGQTGAVKAARQQNRADMRQAVTTRKERNMMGYRASDRAALKASRGEARLESKTATAANRAARQGAVGSAKTGLQDATAGLHAARQAVRSAVKGVRTARRGKY